MRILIAPDSFKESMTATVAAQALTRGVSAVVSAEIDVVPLSDGGEGFIDSVVTAMNGERRTAHVLDARGRPTRATWGLAGDLAIIEAAQANGLEKVEAHNRSIMDSDTRGVGQLLHNAYREGARRYIIGVGGSATNDGGAGMLAELGAVFRNSAGDIIGTTPAELRTVHSVDTEHLMDLGETRVACDVTNPLLGARGAAAIYGPQKGATPEQIHKLDEILGRVSHLLGGDPSQAGAGAAGGLGYALTLLGAELTPGIGIVTDAVGLEERVAEADLILTGEGAIDSQTLMGKAPGAVAKLGARYGKPVIGFAGTLSDTADLYDAGFTSLIPILPGPCDLETALAHGEKNLEYAAARTLRIWGAAVGR